MTIGLGSGTAPRAAKAAAILAAALVLATFAATPAPAVQYGVVTAFTYSTPSQSTPTVETGGFATVGGLGFSSPNGEGDLGGQAAAELHAVVASSFGEATATHVCQCIQQGVEIIMTAVAQDVVTANGGVPGAIGRMRATYWVSGGSIATMGGTSGSLPMSSRGQFNLFSFDPTQAGDGVISTEPPGAGLAGAELLQTGQTNHPSTIDVPIRFGTPIGIRLKLISRSQGSVVQGSFSGQNAHSVRLLTVQLFDANGDPIANPSLTTASGVPIAVVPEPSFAAGLAAAIASLAVGGRRRVRS